ncbi:MAG: DUF1206 domain-containing protein [Leptolyngbyaceae cyanobacterium SM2_3_12]|nr:DUF1206 domain-containing protein [Leptolyngbyaceae cyanobacterium SM2_3_12]
MLIGLFLAQAALDVDDEVAGGLGPTLSQVRDQPLGVVWLGLIALGFLGYGVYMVMAAFYRKFPR